MPGIVWFLGVLDKRAERASNSGGLSFGGQKGKAVGGGVLRRL